MSQFAQGAAVRVRGPNGHVFDGIVKEVHPDCWWDNTEYTVGFTGQDGAEETIRVTEELLDRHNGVRRKRDRKPDGLTKSQRKKRIAEVKAELEDYALILSLDLQSGAAENVRRDRHVVMQLKDELHALYRKEAYSGNGEKETVTTRVYGLGLI